MERVDNQIQKPGNSLPDRRSVATSKMSAVVRKRIMLWTKRFSEPGLASQGRRGGFLWLLSLVLVGLGARFWLTHGSGSPLPFWANGRRRGWFSFPSSRASFR